MMAPAFLVVAIVVMITRHVFKKTGTQLLLSGVRAYSVKSDDSRPSQEELRSMSKKQRKNLERKQMELQTATSNTLTLSALGPRALQSAAHAEDIDALVVLSLTAVLNLLMVVVSVVVLANGVNHMATTATLLSAAFATFVLLKLELSEVQNMNDKAWMLAYLLPAGGAAWALLSPEVVGRRVVNFGLARGVAGLDAVGRGLMARASKLLKEPAPYKMQADEAIVAVSFALMAALIAVALSTPATRFARLLYQQLNPPVWARPYTKQHWLRTATVMAAFVAPLSVVLLQIKPITAFWGLPAAWIPHLTAGALLLTALLHTAAVFSQTQSYLDTGLIEWYTMAHNGVERSNKPQILKVLLDLVRALVAKVGAQMFAPSVLCLGLGAILLIHAGGLQQLTPLAAGPRDILRAKLPEPLRLTLLGDAPVNVTAAAANLAADLAAAGAAAAPAPPPAPPAPQHPESLLEGMDDAVGAGVDPAAGVAAAAGSVAAGAAAVAAGAAAGAITPEAIEAGIRDFFVFVGQFYGWWACAAWCVFAYTTMAMHRIGVNTR